MTENSRALFTGDNPGDVRLIREMVSEATPGACQLTVFTCFSSIGI